MRYRMLAIPAALGLTALLQAQEVVKDVQVEVVHGGPAMAGMAPQAATFQFIAAEPGMLGKTVAGAPYSGEGFTETVQILGDGTRISRKHSKKVWRDAQGRTREEATLPLIGPWTSQGAAPKLITITDPVAKVVYSLNEKDKTATRHSLPDMSGMMAKLAAEHGAKGGDKTMVWHNTKERHEIATSVNTAPAGDVLMAPPPGAGTTVFTRALRIGDGGGKEEALGNQVMEGLKVEGKRVTNTIAAGEVGNDRALVSVTERWNSPELQALVHMTTKDPQMGETTYRLTNIARSEPPASLFQVPADYTVTEASDQFRFERRIETK